MADHPHDPDEVLRKGAEAPFSDRFAVEYTNWIEEQRAWHETCGLTNMSYMLYLHVVGPDALDLFADTSINSFVDFSIGTAKHAVQCNEEGKVISEGLVLRLGADEFVTQGFPAAYLGHVAETGDYDVQAERRDTNVYELEGPSALPIMETLTDSPLRDVRFMHFVEVEVAGREVFALRHGMSGDVGFELHVEDEDGEAVLAAIRDAGRQYGLRRVGMAAALSRGQESGQPQGNIHYLPAIYTDSVPSVFSVMGSFDADDVGAWYRTPVELGWGHYSTFDHEFVGRDALEAEVAAPTRTLVTLVWDDQDVAAIARSLHNDGPTYKQIKLPTKATRGVNTDEVLKDGDLVGTSNYPGYLYLLRETTSLCTIDVEHSEPGTEVTVVWGEGADPLNPMVESHTPKRVTATVAPAPYADENRRSDLN